MTVSSVTSSASSYLTSSNPYQSVQSTYNLFQQNLTSGNLPGAQQVYTALVKALQNSPIGQAGSSVSAPVQQSLIGVATALQSGDINSVQSALTSLGQSINAAAQGAASGTSTQSSSPSALSPSQLTATLINEVMSGMSGSTSSTDPLLAALSSGGVNIIV